MNQDSGNSRANTDEFIYLLTVNQRKIYSYIMKLVANFHDADDIMQETTSVMWKKFDSFNRGTNFLGWAIRIAHYNVLSYRQKKKIKVLFDDELFENIQKDAAKNSDLQERRLTHLKECLAKIKSNDSHLIFLKYVKGLSIKDISGQTNRTTQSLYRAIGRIHTLLMKCIKQKIMIESQL